MIVQNPKVSPAPEEKEEELREQLAAIRLKEIEERVKEEAMAMNLPYINLVGFPIGSEALSLIPYEEAIKAETICFYYQGREARLATPNPANPNLPELRNKLEKLNDLVTNLYLVSKHSFESALNAYASLPKVSQSVKGVEIKEEDLVRYEAEIKSFRDLNQVVQRVNITDLLVLLVAGAIKSRASDIHIEAEEIDVKVRFRIDGVLVDVAILSKKLWPQVITRIKLISGLKINITDRPQDGRFTIYLTNDRIDVRVSCLPTAFGESVVMRLLRSSQAGLAFEDLGLRGLAYEQLKKEIERPNGMILTTGPTGSGKTTTLYAIINKLNNPQTKIITLEDPIEYRLKGINQSQVDVAKGYTYAKGLRALMRQDPDVLMIGEIRDLETAEIAIQAALTGHLVISTLHTNDAAGALPRLLAIGAKPYLLAPAINAIIGQRLVRRICEKCKEEKKYPPEIIERVKKYFLDLPDNEKEKIDLDNLKFYHGKGCEECQGLGYRGRIGIFEILLMSPEIEKLVLTGQVSEYQMRDLAKKQGMITMVQDGLLKAIDGITTIDEVFRVAE
jgi:type IV pilus assembly protein PilB